MSNSFGKDWAEKCQEALDNDPVNYIVDNHVAMEDFIVHVESSLHPDAFNGLIDSWLKTEYGKKWYENTLDKLIRDCPENEEDWRLDR